MSELYLIAHKVRGEPAFDIASPMEIELPDGSFEEWWIIPTSGHRAYPYWHMGIDALFSYVPGDEFMWGPPTMPDGLTDHYEATAAKGEGKVTDLYSRLFKPAPSTPLTRRM